MAVGRGLDSMTFRFGIFASSYYAVPVAAASIMFGIEDYPWVQGYAWSSGFGTKYADPASPPSYAGSGITFNPTGDAFAVAHLFNPYISAYPWSAGFGSKYANPATLPEDHRTRY